MFKERYVNTKFWDDNYIVKLDPIEKLLFLYFLTNPLTNICGIYEISPRRIAFDTGIEEETILTILERFKKAEKIMYQNNYVVIKNFTKYQKNNPKINKGIELVLAQIPKELIKWANIDWDRLSIDYDSLSKATNYSNTNTNTNSNSNTNSNKEEETKSPPTPYQEIQKIFNQKRNNMPEIKILSGNRKNAIRLRYKKYGLDGLTALFEKAGKSNFLNGKNNKKWVATFDWLIEEKNMVKTLEGNFDNKEKKGRGIYDYD